jgi:predicted membrane-bound spermidine synthase
MITARGIQNAYVNKYYLDDNGLAQRSSTLMERLSLDGGINEDFYPLAYYRQLLYWLSYFRFQPYVIGIAFLVMLGILAYRLTAVSFGIFTAGFAAASIEFLLLFSFQVLLGYLYQFIGLLIAIFMAGLAAGAWFAYRQFGVATVRRFVLIQVLIAVLALVLPWLMVWTREVNIGAWFIQTLILAFAALTASLVGMQFAQATPLLKGSVIHVASELYGFDLIGSALGAFLSAIFLLPLFGLSNVSYMVAGLCFISALIGVLRSKKLA